MVNYTYAHRQLSMGPDAVICIMVGQQLTLFEDSVKCKSTLVLLFPRD